MIDHEKRRAVGCGRILARFLNISLGRAEYLIEARKIPFFERTLTGAACSPCSKSWKERQRGGAR